MIVHRHMHDRLIRDALRSSIFALLLAALPATAATITVTTLADELNADGDCSLREALQASNTNAAVDACVAGTAGLDVIILPAGTIPLSVTVNITDAVTIRGAGRASTTIQRGTTTAFNGTGVVGATLTLEDLAMVGQINTGGTQDIAITRVDFTGTTGTTVNSLNGAITIADTTMTGGVNSLNGNIAISNSTLTGGGVNSSGGALTIANTAISGGSVNTSTGAISLTRVSIANSSSTGVNSSSGAVTLVDSAVNNAGSNGVNTSSGAISLTRSLVSGSQSRGVNSSSGAITVVNSTISGNATTGINASTSTITLNAATVTLNADEGVDGAAGTISMINSIVAGNAPDCGVAVASGQFSLSSDASCGLTGAGNRPSTNPLLGPLANNGGPTLTHLPQAGSPAIDAGSNALCQAVDQRNVARPVDGNGDGTATCDMGAVEAGAGAPPPPPPPPPPSAPPADIPTLSEWGLIALVLVLGLASARSLRRGRITGR